MKIEVNTSVEISMYCKWNGLYYDQSWPIWVLLSRAQELRVCNLNSVACKVLIWSILQDTVHNLGQDKRKDVGLYFAKTVERAKDRLARIGPGRAKLQSADEQPEHHWQGNRETFPKLEHSNENSREKCQQRNGRDQRPTERLKNLTANNRTAPCAAAVP